MARSSSPRPRVFLDISEDTTPIGRIIIELFTEHTPKTCENFRTLCTSPQPPNYKLSPFHRIIDTFMLQGGDITAGNGTGGTSIYGPTFPDENLSWRPLDSRGLVCMANRGPNTNSSQFFITLAPCPHLNGRHTVFGRVVPTPTSDAVLTRMSSVPVDSNDKPLTPLLITHTVSGLAGGGACCA
ncbi:hypothetical protein EJ06DRAFT_541261 [Trichodelitschia bisporula]|uniref:Peptidyl-prolyl cis-trans isomerase n=1 Tax=Trichodelitschia bisporula TaxID=703511 RepID=A0A6G1I5B1_9PEZI|nr:hypothetical protein EJ06DRAFT_541261 [Trichodelitschia bisporula]